MFFAHYQFNIHIIAKNVARDKTKASYRSAEQHLSSKLCLVLYAESHHSKRIFMASCNQIQDKALLPLVSHLPTSSCAILDLALSACYSRIYQGLSFSHQIFCMATSSSCCDIFGQVVEKKDHAIYAYYQSTYLRAWLQTPDLSPPYRLWP